MKHYFLLFLILFSFHIYNTAAQYKGNIDSLKSVLTKSPNNLEALAKLAQSLEYSNMDTSYTLALSLHQKAMEKRSFTHITMAEQIFGNYHLINNRLDSAAIYFDKMIESAKRSNDSTMIASGLSSRGQVSVAMGKLGEGIQLFQDCLLIKQAKLDTERDPDGLADCYGFLGDAYYLAGLYNESLENQFKCLEILTTLKKNVGVGMCYNSIGSVYSSMENYPKALHYFEKGLVLMKKEKFALAIGTIYFNIAEIHFKLNDQQNAIQLIDSAEKIILASGTTYNLNSIYNLRAEINRKQKRFASAENYFSKAITLNEESGTTIQLGQSLIGLAGLYMDIGKYNEANDYLNKALNLFAKDSSRKDIKDAYQRKLQIAIKQNNGSSAEMYLQAYEKANTIFLNDEKQKAIVAQEIKFETREKEKLIQFQRESLDAKKRESQFYLFAMLAAITGICLLLWFVWRIKKQKSIIESQKNEIVHNTKNNLQQLISIFNRQAEDETYRDKALDNQGRLQALTLLNQLLYDAESNGFVPMKKYIHELCKYKQMAFDTKVNMQLDVKDMITNARLAKDIGLIINELITNAYKYAFAGIENPTIWVKLSKTIANTLYLEIGDNGKGFAASEEFSQGTSMGFGFVNDLVDQHHGQLSVNSEGGLQYQITLKTT